MIRYSIVGTILLIVACEPRQPRPIPDGVEGDTFLLVASRDEKHGVTCYRIAAHEGLSCLRDVAVADAGK
jgi:hypothetical protein